MQASNVGTLGSLYTVSYFGQNITNGDTFVPLNVQSQPFCVGLTVDSLGNAILVGGDNQCVGCLYRTAAEQSANIPYPNGYYDVRRFVPGAAKTGMTVPARMFDVNSRTGVANTARDCCIQLPADTQPIPDNCVPDANCSPRCASAAQLSALLLAGCPCPSHTASPRCVGWQSCAIDKLPLSVAGVEELCVNLHILTQLRTVVSLPAE